MHLCFRGSDNFFYLQIACLCKDLDDQTNWWLYIEGLSHLTLAADNCKTVHNINNSPHVKL